MTAATHPEGVVAGSARMLVACHKPATVPTDALYLPVQVGRSLTETDLGLQSDNTGDNISHLNGSYCELTAVYWAWKNLDADALGLSHYRRYFVGTQAGPSGKGVLSAAEARELLARYDVVLPRPRNYVIETIESHYRNGHHGDDLDVLQGVVADLAPEYLEAYRRVFSGRKLSLYNMFLMDRSRFDEFASWLFPILQSVNSQIDYASRTSYQKRTMGYLGERMLNVWVAARARDLKIGTRRVVNTEGEPRLKKAVGLLRRKLRAGPDR